MYVLITGRLKTSTATIVAASIIQWQYQFEHHLPVNLFVPLLLQDPFMDLYQTWWIHEGGHQSCLLEVVTMKGQGQ